MQVGESVILMVKEIARGSEGRRQINLILNWFEELRRVPTR